MNFEASSEQQESCIEKIKEAGSDDVNPIYLLKKPIIDKKADYDYLNTVLNTIEKIRENNPTVLPDDIGIIFMENSNDNFELASKLQLLIREKYNWKVNIGYETKEKVEGTLFISNRNNVKGLEFPFVICIMQNALTYNYSI